jgi:putative heme-binding domain-containing protein
LQTIIAMAMAGNIKRRRETAKAIQEGKASDCSKTTPCRQDCASAGAERQRSASPPDQRVAHRRSEDARIDERTLPPLRRSNPTDAQQAAFAKHCGICHQIGNEGTKIGPQLDGIGGRGLDRLLEDILDPNRNVDVAFRQTTLMLKDGKGVVGLLLLREEGQTVVMADDKGKEFAWPRTTSTKPHALLQCPPILVEAIPEKDFTI